MQQEPVLTPIPAPILARVKRFRENPRCINALFLLLVGFTAIGLAGCDSTASLEARRQTNPDNYKAVQDVFVVSNRQVTRERGLDLSHFRSANVKYGVYRVSVPKAHVLGRLEYAIPRRSHPGRHFEVVAKQVQRDPGRLIASLNLELERYKAAGRSRGILLFVHGFNYTFPETVFQIAQLSFDTNNQLVPVAFAWPSRGTLSGYGFDRESVSYSRDDLTATLQLLGQSNADSIMVLAHSMGAALTMESLRQLSLSGDVRTLSKIKNLTLTSPDIALGLFVRQLRAINPLPEQMVVMTSGDDRALGLSRVLSRSQARIGSLGEVSWLTGLGLNVVDITAISEPGFVNHSKFSKSPATISFLKLVMRMQHPAYQKIHFNRMFRVLSENANRIGLSVYPAAVSAATPAATSAGGAVPATRRIR